MNAGWLARPTRNARGVVLVWYALFLLLILAFIAVGVDMAKLQATRTQLQNAADAAALAGASAVDPTTGVLNPTIARSRAVETAMLNRAFVDTPEPVMLTAGNITMIDQDKIKVTAVRAGGTSIVTHFAQVLGITGLEMSATATAQAETTRTADCGVVPLGVAPPAGGTFLPGCGQNYVLKSGGGSGTNGNYGALDMPPCGSDDCPTNSGASRWRCLMSKGYCCEVAVGDAVPTERGNMSGPFRDAINDRFQADAVQTEGICYSDYLASGGTGSRVVVVPIVNLFPSGNGVTITGFAGFFIKRRPGNGANSTLEGEFVYAVIPGEGGGSGGSGAVAFSVHLIPNP